MWILIYYIICDCNNIFHQINVDQYGRLNNILLQIYSTQLICLLRIYISFQHHDWVIHTDRLIFRKWLPGSGMLPIVQCFPFQPVRQIHVPLSHWPLIPSQRGSQLRVSHKTPPHPSSHTQRWLWQYPFIQRRRHISKIYPVTTYQAKHRYQSMIKVCHFPQH